MIGLCSLGNSLCAQRVFGRAPPKDERSDEPKSFRVEESKVDGVKLIYFF